MKKSILVALTAAMVLSMSTLTAFAAPSATVSDSETTKETTTSNTSNSSYDDTDYDKYASSSTAASTTTTTTTTTSAATAVDPKVYVENTTVSEGYTVSAVDATTEEATNVAVQNAILGNLEVVAQLLGDKNIAAAIQDPTQEVTAQIRSIVNVDPTTATKNANGKYEFTLTSKFLGTGRVLVLHYNGNWETLVPKAVNGQNVVVESDSCSPFAIVELNVASTTGANTVATSPKTGETLPVAMMVVVLGIVGAAVCTKKIFA